MGISEVLEDIPLEVVEEEEEEEEQEEEFEDFEIDESGDLRAPNRRLRRNNAQSRAKSLDKKRLRQEKEYRNLQLQIALDKIGYALQSKSEKAIKQAIRAAENAGMKASTGKGKFNCTQSLRSVYKLQYEMDVKVLLYFIIMYINM